MPGLAARPQPRGLRRIDWLLRRPIDVFVLELGANDGLRGIDPKDTHANLQQIVERVKAKNPAVALVIAGMQMPPNLGRNTQRRLPRFSRRWQRKTTRP